MMLKVPALFKVTSPLITFNAADVRLMTPLFVKVPPPSMVPDDQVTTVFGPKVEASVKVKLVVSTKVELPCKLIDFTVAATF